MEELIMSASGREGVDKTDETKYVWGGEKPKGNYKSVDVRGEVYEVGHCVQCNLESKESFIWKILKFFQDGDRKLCRIRRLFTELELPRNVNGLDPPAEAKELFLASNGPDVQEEISVGKLARRYIIFCTFRDDDELNPIPTSDDIKKADYFFHRGYDPARKEVVELDVVVEELGAQYVYNKSGWLGDNVARRSSSGISASRIHSQSPASGSSALQGVSEGMYSPALEVSPAPEVSSAPSRDSTERKLKKRKSDNLAPEQHKVDAVEKKNELHAPKKRKKSTMSRSDHVVFAIPAPAKTKSIRGQGVSPGSAKPPASTSKPIQREGKEHISKTSSSPTARVGSKQTETKAGIFTDRKRKDGEMPTEWTVKKIVKHGERSNAPFGRENLSKPQRRADEVIGKATPFGSSFGKATFLGSKQTMTKDGGGSIERQKKNGEEPSEEAVKKNFKPGERPSASSGNPSKPQKRGDEKIVMTTSHVARKVPSAPTSLANRVKIPTVEIPTANPSATKTDRSVPGASPRASKEAVKTDIGSRVLKWDEDVAQVPSTSLRQSGSPSLIMSAIKETGSTPKSSILPKLSLCESPRAILSKSLSDRDIDIMNSSPAASLPEESRALVFKTTVEDWDATIGKAIQSNRVLLLKNVDPELQSEDLAEALTEHMKSKCEVRIAPPMSFSYQTTTALVKLPNVKTAQGFLEKLESHHVMVANRVVTAATFNYDEFRGRRDLKHPGHLEFSQVRDHHVEDYRNAVATSHLAQGNTIEFAYGLPWRVLDEQHEDQWRMLQEAHSAKDRTDI